MDSLTLESWLSFVVQLGCLIVGGLWFLAKLDSRIKELIADRKLDSEGNKTRFDKIEEELRKLVDAMVQLARQEERLNGLDQRVGDLSKRVEANRVAKLSAHKTRKATR